MPTGLWVIDNNGEAKFASTLARASGKDFELLFSALDEEAAQEGLLRKSREKVVQENPYSENVKDKTMLELALHRFMKDYRNQSKITRLIIKLINVCPELLKVNSYYDCPPLHYAAKKLNYSIFKMLLRAENLDPNFADNHGKYIWEYLFDRKNLERFRDFIYVLIKHPNFDIKKNKPLIMAATREYDDIWNEQSFEIEDLLDAKEKEKELFDTKTWPPTHWVKSFDLAYYRGDQRHQKEDLIIDCNNPHLMLKAFQTLAATRLKKDAVQNVASAIITFVISYKADNKTYITDHNITIGEDYYNYTLKFMDDPNYAQHLQNELAEYLGKEFFVNNSEKWKVTKSKEEITPKHGKFDIRFKHSEQTLFLYLRKNIDRILKELREELEMLGFDKRNPTFKIKAVVLNIFSERYMCQHCQATALAFQKPSAFIEPLINEALRLGFKDNRYSDVKLTIMVSANTPLFTMSEEGKKEKDKIKKQQIEEQLAKKYRVSEDDHSPVEIDIKTLPSGHIFFRDTSKVDIPLTAFFISGGKNIIDRHKQLEGENRKLKENDKKSQEEKKNLQLTNRNLQKTVAALTGPFDDEPVAQKGSTPIKSNNQQSASSAATIPCLDSSKGEILAQPNNKKRERDQQQPEDSEMRAPKSKIPNSETNVRFVNTASNNNSFPASASAAEALNETTPDQMEYDDADQIGNLEQSYKSFSPS